MGHVMLVFQFELRRKYMAKREVIVLVLIASVLGLIGCNNDNSNNVVTGGSQPTITSFTPAQVFLGEQKVHGTLMGTNLTGVTAVSLGAGITVNTTTAVSSVQLTVVFSVSKTAASGPHTITVSTASGNASNSSVFSISSDKPPV